MIFLRVPSKFSKHLDKGVPLLIIEAIVFSGLTVVFALSESWFSIFFALVLFALVFILSCFAYIFHKKYKRDTVELTENGIVIRNYKNRVLYDVEYAKIKKAEVHTLRFWYAHGGTVDFNENERFICVFLNDTAEISDGMDYRDFYKEPDTVLFSYSDERLAYIQSKLPKQM